MMRPVLREPMRSVLRGTFDGLSGINFDLYNFYVNFPELRDQVSGSLLQATFEAGRWPYSGPQAGEDEAVFEPDGSLLIDGAYVQLVPYSEDTSNWTGAGPWTQVLTISATGTYILSTNLNGATVTITAGTATIDAGASATFGNPDQFVVTGIGTVTISTDIADPKAQITLSPYVLPYAVNTTAGTLSVPLNYADATHGVKAEGIQANFPQLFGALDGVGDGSELVTNGDGSSTVGWTPNSGGIVTSVSGRIRCAMTEGQFGKVYQTLTTVIGERYYYGFDYFSGTMDDNLITYRAGTTPTGVDVIANTIKNGDGIETGIFTAISTTTYFSWNTGSDTTGGHYFEVDDATVKQISPAQGRITIPFTFKFDAADSSGTINILTANDEAASFSRYNIDSEQFELFDGTNTAVVAYTAVNGTSGILIADYGDDTGQKMRLTVDATVGAQATNAGSFPVTADDLSIGWETDEPIQIGAILIEKEPTW